MCVPPTILYTLDLFPSFILSFHPPPFLGDSVFVQSSACTHVPTVGEESYSLVAQICLLVSFTWGSNNFIYLHFFILYICLAVDAVNILTRKDYDVQKD